MKTKILLLTFILGNSLYLYCQSFEFKSDTNVIYYDYAPDTVLSTVHDTLKIDFNQDGLLDIKITLKEFSWGQAIIVTNIFSSCNYQFLYSRDSLTSPAINWTYWDNQWLFDYNYINTRLGIRITNGDKNYYGWLSGRVSGPAISRIITIDNYAFCKIANYPFLFGQTEINTGIPGQDLNTYLRIRQDFSGNLIFIDSDKTIERVNVIAVTGASMLIKDHISSKSAGLSKAELAHGLYIIQVIFADETKKSIKVFL